MNVLSQARKLLFRTRRVAGLMSVTGLVVVIGLPIPVAMAGTVPILREVSTSCPTVNRDTAPARILELKGRLAERSKAIEKTKRMLPGLQEGSRAAWDKADSIMSDKPAGMLKSFATDYLKTTSSIKKRIKAMRNSGMSKEKINFWLKTMKRLEDTGSFLQKAPASFEAGTKFGLNHQAEMANLQNEIIRTSEIFADSGLVEELGGEFASKIGGPLGKLAFDAGVTSIDLIATTEEAFIEAGAARQVQNSINTMQWAYNRDEGEMERLNYLLALPDCGKQPEQVAESSPPSEPPPPPPAVVSEAPVTTAPVSAPVAGPDLGPILLIGGAAAAGAAALAVGLGGLAGANCGSPPQGFGNAWWAEYSEWCICEGGTPIVSTTQCVQ